MMVKMYESTDEVLLFRVNSEGEAVGEGEYFTGEPGDTGDRNRDDYDVNLVELPLSITSRVRTDPARVLTA